MTRAKMDIVNVHPQTILIVIMVAITRNWIPAHHCCNEEGGGRHKEGTNYGTGQSEEGGGQSEEGEN